MLVHETVAHAARYRPNHTALVDGTTAITYRRLDERVRRLAAALRDGYGFGAQERLALLSRNRYEFVEIVYAAAMAGAVCVPINYRLTPREIVEIIVDAGPRLLVAERIYEPVVSALRADGYDGRIVWIDDDTGKDSYGDLLRGGSAEGTAFRPRHGDIVLQMYTSGTTGRPKGVLLSHRNLMATSWSHLAEGTSILRSDRYLVTAPLCHLAALSRMLYIVHAGATHVIHPNFDPARVMETMYSEQANCTFVVPAMIRPMLDAAAARGGSFQGKVRLINYGAAPMPTDLLTEALQILGCGFQQGYGLTESAGMLTLLQPQDHLPDSAGGYSQRISGVGRQAVGVQIRVVDAGDNDVPIGTVGEVLARGENVMEGYWRNPEETRLALRDGWLHTGDLGRLEQDHYLTLVGRSKDLIVSGGFNVYPREIEVQLEHHPLVAEAAVVGIPDERWGEVPLAYIVLRTAIADPDQVFIQFLSDRLARFKLPRRFRFVDSLPRNAGGKVMKMHLRELAK